MQDIRKVDNIEDINNVPEDYAPEQIRKEDHKDIRRKDAKVRNVDIHKERDKDMEDVQIGQVEWEKCRERIPLRGITPPTSRPRTQPKMVT